MCHSAVIFYEWVCGKLMLNIVFLTLYCLSLENLNPVLQAWHINSYNTKAKHVFIFLLRKEEIWHKEIKINISKSASSVTCLCLICLSCLWWCGSSSPFRGVENPRLPLALTSDGVIQDNLSQGEHLKNGDA